MTAANDLGRWSARQPDAEAVVIVDADGVRPAERITYGDLDAAANRLARALLRGTAPVRSGQDRETGAPAGPRISRPSVDSSEKSH